MSHVLHSLFFRVVWPFSNGVVLLLGVVVVAVSDVWWVELPALVSLLLSASSLGWTIGHGFAHRYCFAHAAQQLAEILRVTVRDEPKWLEAIDVHLTHDVDDGATVPDVRRD